MTDSRANEPTTTPTRPAASRPARLFRIAAFAEALSWLGLLIGMFFKWIVQSTEVGVKIFGPIHGGIFMLFVACVLWVSSAHKWSPKQTLLGLVSSIPPFATIWFERRAERIGLLDHPVTGR